MRKRGFTLVELLAVVVIIGILLILAVPAVNKYIKRGKNSYYNSLEKEVKVAGVDYMETYRTLLPRVVGHAKIVTLKDLVDNKYIEEVKDEKGNLCIGQVTVIKSKKDSFDYYSCIKCGDYYASSGRYCEEDDATDTGFKDYEGNNQYADSGDYNIEVSTEGYRIEDGKYIAEQGKEYTLPLGNVYYKQNPDPIINDLQPRNKLDINRLGEQKIRYVYHGALKEITVKVIDISKPESVKVVLKYNDSKGKSYKGEWFSGNIYALYKSTDYVDKGIQGSGIDHYEVSDDGINFKRLESDNQGEYEKLDETSQLLKKEGNYTRYVKAVDKEGNVSEVVSYSVKIDKTKPTCTFSGESTNWIGNANSPVTRHITATCHDSISDCTDDTKTKDFSSSTTTKTKYISYVMKDLAGNEETCGKTANYYVDNTKPTCSYSGESTSWTSGNRTISYGCSDGTNQSGCVTSTRSVTYTNSTTTEPISYSIQDAVGNTNSCSKNLNVYIDKVYPTITYKSNPLNLGSSSYTFTTNTTSTCGGPSSCTTTCSPSTNANKPTSVSCRIVNGSGLSDSTSFTVQYSYTATSHSGADAVCGRKKVQEQVNRCECGGDCNDSCSCSCSDGTCPNHNCHLVWVDKVPAEYYNETCTYYTCDKAGSCFSDGTTKSKTKKTCYYEGC